MEEAPCRGDETVLDLGCGTGLFTEWLGARVRRAVGLDISPALLGLSVAAPRVLFCRYDGQRIPLASSTFDYVLSSEVVHLLSDRLLELCGYSLYKGIMGHIDGRSPASVLGEERLAERAYASPRMAMLKRS